MKLDHYFHDEKHHFYLYACANTTANTTAFLPPFPEGVEVNIVAQDEPERTKWEETITAPPGTSFPVKDVEDDVCRCMMVQLDGERVVYLPPPVEDGRCTICGRERS